MSLPTSCSGLQAALLCREVSVPQYEPDSSVNMERCPVSWLQDAAGRQEAWFWAVMGLRDLGVVLRHSCCLLFLCLPLPRAVMCPPCTPARRRTQAVPVFQRGEKRNEAMG